MSKKLTPLEALEKIVNDHCIDNEDEELDIIETALKDYEKIKFEHSELRTYHYDLLKENERLHNQKVKKLKALKIIKRCPVEIIEILDTYSSWEEYRQDYRNRSERQGLIQSKQEFDLLKEVLL